MKLSLLPRFLLASLIISATVPMLYHIVLNYTRREHFENLTAEICKAIEPDVQRGADRSPIEYAKSVLSNQGFDFTPELVFIEHGAEVTPPHRNRLEQVRVDCKFAGITGREMSIYYESAPFT